MKKIFAALLSVLILASFIGCGGNDGAEESSNSSESVTTVGTIGQTEETIPATRDDDPAENKPVSVHEEHYMHGECSVTLLYPRFGDTNHDAYDLSVRNYAVQMFNESGLLPEDSAVYEVTYCEIKYESEYFVSALIVGQVISPDNAYENNFAYTVNADPRTGKIYLSDELIGDVELMKAAVADGGFVQKYGFGELMDEVTPDVITGSWRADYGVFPDMYFTKDSLGIVAEVPRAVGGFAGFEISYVDAGEMINPVAKGLCGIIVTTE